MLSPWRIFRETASAFVENLPAPLSRLPQFSLRFPSAFVFISRLSLMSRSFGLPHVCSFVLLCLLGTAPLFSQQFDLVVRNGRVIDGNGNPAFFADVAVKDGRIVAIGRALGSGKTEIDAKGLIVSPGFIDVHTHGEDIVTMNKAENFLRMGVTTIVMGNCGSSVKDVTALWTKIAEAPISANVGTLVGLNTVRRAAMGGNYDRLPSADEMTKMKASIDKAMRDGALGISTGLTYLPGTFTKTDEITELAKVAAAYDGIHASHMRSESTGIFKSVDELLAVSRGSGIRSHISHTKVAGPKMWGKSKKLLETLDKARAEGIDITQDQYAYTASSTSLSQIIASEFREGKRSDFLERIKNPETKAAIVKEMKDSLRSSVRKDFSYAVIASYSKNPALNGKNVVEAAKLVRGSDSLDDQIELIIDIHANGGAHAIYHTMNEEDIQAIMRHPNTMIACDSGIREFGEGVPHPRGYGNNARVLARYVRELHVLRLEDAIRRMTSLPASTFRMKDRGCLREGAWADIVVFDPEKIQDNASFSDPHHYSTGLRAVLVNGVVVVDKDAHTGAKPGKPVLLGK